MDMPITATRRGRVKLLESGDNPFVVADVATIEVVFALCRYYGFRRGATAEAITGLMTQPKIDCNRALFKSTLRLFIDHPKLSFGDCYLTTYAELSDTQPLWTFDKKLAGQASSARPVPM